MPTSKILAILPDQFTSFGELLKFLRRRAGLSQRELSIAVGYSESQISRLERDERAPDTAALAARFVEALALEKDREWMERLLQLGAKSHAERERQIEASHSPVTPHNLPKQLSSFIGREQELAEIKEFLSVRDRESPSRLLTLTGAGGSGKTRLGLQAAAELLTDFPDGVWFVNLAPITDAMLVIPAILQTLRVTVVGNQPPLDALKEYLREKQLLLVLDNFEQVLDAAPALNALLTAAPALKLLVTSRGVLDLSGEQEFLVPPLPVPNLQLSAVDAVGRNAAVALFVQRAQGVRKEFQLTAANAPAVAAICVRLDGLPLAIELAAARSNVLAPNELLARLSSRLGLLTGGARDLPARQQTLRSTIDWSYQLLKPDEQKAFMRLGIFVGGWSLESAEQVCTAQQDIPGDMVDILDALLHHNLIQQNVSSDEALRFGMLETFREYAREKLVGSGEEDELQTRHFEFFLKFAQEAEPQLTGAEQVTWLKRLEREHDNLRAALEWSRTLQGRPQRGLCLAGALYFFWGVRGYFQEGREHLMAALRQTPAYPTEARAKALNGAGYLAYRQGDYAAARTLLDASLSVYRALGPVSRHGLSHTLLLRGYLESEVGAYATASALMLQSLDIMRELNDEWGIAGALRDLGGCAVRAGDDARGARYLEEALPLLRRFGDQNSTSITLSGLAEIALRQANYERATALEQESLTLRREREDKWGIAVSLGNLAWIALRRGDLEQAVVLLQESVMLRRKIGDPGGIAWCLEKLAQVAMTKAQSKSAHQRREHFQRAAVLLGAAAALRAPSGSVVDLVDQPEYERQLTVLRTQLGEQTFAKSWAEGQALPLEQAIEYALV